MKFQSLAIKTLWKMSVRIAAIVVVVGSVYYIQLQKTIEAQAKDNIIKYLKEREARERINFDLARQNHATLSAEFLKAYHSWLKNPALSTEYNTLLKPWADGLFRNRNPLFDGRSMTGVFVGDSQPADKVSMARVMAAYAVSSQLGVGYHHLFQDTYFTFPNNALVLYWPEQPDWIKNVNSDYRIDREEYAQVSSPENNPDRVTVWTGLFYDNVSKCWMVTASTPIYDGDQFLGNVHHDLMVNELIDRTLNDHLRDSQNFIVRKDGRLIAHADHFDEIKNYNGKFDLNSGLDKKLLKQFQVVSKIKSGEIGIDDYDNYLAVVQIPGPDWLLVTEYPRQIVGKEAMNNAGFLVVAGIISLLMEIVLIFFVLRKEVSEPLLKLIRTTDKIASGEYGVKHKPLASDEIGQLAVSINKMSDAIFYRDGILARHNEDLENLIIERNRELDEQKAINLNASKMFALGEMARGISQDVNAPLGNIRSLALESEKELQAQRPNFESVRKNLLNIQSAVERVSRIVIGLKSYTRTGSSDPFIETDLKKVLLEAVELCSDRCRRRHVDLTVGMPDNSILIRGRSVEIGQVILNLVNNSCDAVESLDEKWINIHVIEFSDRVEIRVTDSGTGIPFDLQKKIFQPFFTTKHLGQSAGMGLSISAGIIRNHKGYISLDNSSLNTCFVVQLPKLQCVDII